MYTLIFLVLLMSAPIFADSTNLDNNRSITYLENGEYITSEIVIDYLETSTYGVNTKSAHRIYTYYNSRKEKAWDLTVYGTFSYNGKSATATAVSSDYNIYISGWKCISRTPSKSRATVQVKGNFKYGSLNVTKTIGLKCSPTGVISAT